MADESIVKQAVEPALDTVGTTVVSALTSPTPFAELGFGLIVLVLVITLHGWCLGAVSKFFAVRFARFQSSTAQWHVNLLVSATIALLACVHLLETLVWASPIWWFGMIPGFRDAYFFVLESYTTLGEATVVLPEAWRLIGPIIAISGLFTFSWTGSVLVYVMTETSRRHSQVDKSPESAVVSDQS